ncbi:MAG: glutathione S-transferase N-terminal domain-containing protein [Deltaproteobacteria bacterium]|nr:glutathione S-transferase N-terminal domain-containing protein [Deltaproteobacteria bacterium]
MKLFYKPGSCALAPHIALHWIGKPFELERVDQDKMRAPEYLKLNPLGKVPALIEDDGQVLTECGAILEYLADRSPETKLGPGADPRERYEIHQWLSHLGGNVHPAFFPFFNPGRYSKEAGHHPAIKDAAVEAVNRQMELLNERLAGREWVALDRKTIVDAYLFAILRWIKNFPRKIAEYPNLHRFYQKMAADPGVQRAMADQKVEA